MRQLEAFHLRPGKIGSDRLRRRVGDIRTIAGGARLVHAGRRHVNHRRGHNRIAIREARSPGEQSSPAGDERAAIINGPARFIAEQIAVNVAGIEGA